MSARWYRAYEGTVTDAKLGEVALVAGCSRSVAIAAWHCILESAASVNASGRFDVTARRVAVILGEPVPVIEAVFAEMAALDMICDAVVSAWQRRQFASDTAKDRVRRHRERKRDADAREMEHCETSPQCSVTLHDCFVTPPYTDTDTYIPPLPPETGGGDATQNLIDDDSSTQAGAPEVMEADKRPSTDPAQSEPPQVERPPKAERPPKPKRRAARIDPDWKPTESDRAFALSVGIPERDIDRQGAEFVDYWIGSGGTKADWAATWRNRCRQIAEFKSYKPPASAPHAPPPRPAGWPSRLPDPERCFEVWRQGKWSFSAWGFPPDDPSCQIPSTIIEQWKQRRAEAA